MTVKTSIEVPIERLADLLTSAFEGGSNYWYKIVAQGRPSNFDTYRAFPKDNPHKEYPHIEYPTNPDGYLTIIADEGDKDEEACEQFRLDLPAIERGFQLFAESKTFAHHFRDFMSEDDDATTGDVFLQLCLFGDVVYG